MSKAMILESEDTINRREIQIEEKYAPRISKHL